VKRLIPRSLIGQMALVIGIVLLVAQAINFASIRSERQRLGQTQLEGPVMTRFVAATSRMVDRGRERPIENRRGRVLIGDQSIVAAQDNDEDLSTRLREIAAANGLEVRDARAALSDTLPPPSRGAEGERRGGQLSPEERAERFRSLLLSIQLADSRWVNGQLLILRPSSWPLVRLGIETLLFYVLLLAAIIFVLARLVRPLGDLTRAAQRFRGQGEPHVEPRGPADVRRAIEAFNAMNSRVASLLDEKDRMLGAIGHDLRTPLASLRIRAESMEPAEERERMIATIEEMTSLMDDTLALARSGRSSEPLRQLDVAALADAVVEEFRELEQDVTFGGTGRVVASVRSNLVRGALRNLIDNAVKYAGSACVSVSSAAGQVIIEVSDRGPGIPSEHLAKVQEPFVRLEASRSRETGGSGLGITLARAAAHLHGGELELVNREGGGLTVRMLLPCR
jgi:signal transduction histidine kinase